ncbi:hypothetical protein LFT45_22670 (plasmid) [Arthrobacter sp. FW305-BF8]|uniref:hypothetical protein n=1 Tax=Arthrobacter sp. FW305-BF8 TaxID=2879617 RepID=UPI001F1D9278|nr:hypothetical protein [Arthrobacter sp. FW305-BF8]UKA56683.1 hypothetical protein LFT45_22670 [Arthrobacter sp. FW305-BF8]
MGLMYDDPRLAALTLLRIAAEEAEGPSGMTGRMHAVMGDLVQRNGAGYLAELAIALARTGFIAVDELARRTGNSTAELLDAVEVDTLEGLDGDC